MTQSFHNEKGYPKMKYSQPVVVQDSPDTNADFSKIRLSGKDLVNHTYIDLAIFDLMADGKRRAVTDVEAELAVLGYNRRDINTRMVGMLFKKQTFVHNGEGRPGANRYVMKKGAKRPIERRDPPVAATPVPSEIQLKPEVTRPLVVTPPKPLVPTVIEPTLPVTDVPSAVASVIDLIVREDDPVKVALWKVMNDHQPYTLDDLAAFLEHITRRTIESQVDMMVADGRIDHQRGRGNTPALYTLKVGVPQPSGEPKYRPRYDVRKEVPKDTFKHTPPPVPMPVPKEPVQIKSGELDDLNREMLDFIQQRGEATIAEVARRFNEVTLRGTEARVRRMAAQGLLEVTRKEDMKANSYRFVGFVEAKDEPIQQVETKKVEPTPPVVPVEPTTPQWELKLDALETLGRDKLAEQEALARAQEEAAEREAKEERDRLQKEAEDEQRRLEQERAAAQQKEKQMQQHFTDPAVPVETNKPGVYATQPTPLVQVGGIHIKGRRFGFRDALTILEELEGSGFLEADVTADLNNDKRKFVKLELRINIAGMEMTVNEAKFVAQQLKKDLD